MAENRNFSFNGIVDSLMKGMDGFLSSKTVVGDATRIGDTIIVPLVDVSFGVGAGSAAYTKGGGEAGALNGKMSPSAVLVISNGHTKLVNIKNQDTMTKILDLIPELVDRFQEKGKPQEISDDDAIDVAFPDKTPEIEG